MIAIYLRWISLCCICDGFVVRGWIMSETIKTFIVFLPLLLMTRLLPCFLNIWTLMLQILSTVSKSFSASDSLKNEPGKQILMIIVSEYAGKLPIRLIPLWLNMPKEIKRAEWRNKRECWSICHLICTYAIAGCHSTKMLIRFAALLLRII